jgi:predicted nucleic acid-binding Zn ribbon protein
MVELQNTTADNPADNEEGESALERVAFAKNMMEESATRCKELGADLRESLQSVSHVYLGLGATLLHRRITTWQSTDNLIFCLSTALPTALDRTK